jgi:hypothetical protein
MNIKSCRICKGSNFSGYLNLGHTPAADSFIRKQGLSQPEVHYPLEVVMCDDCGISQLSYTVPAEILFQRDYPYESSTTIAGRKHFFNFAKLTSERFSLGADDLAIDIGSNVGVLLDGFRAQNCRILGIEPSANISAIAISKGIETINDFISPELALQVVDSHGQASIITTTNVFAHIDDLDEFMIAIDILLNDKGVFIIEAPHFLKLIKNLEYDTIYHEHLLYLSLRPLNKLFSRFGFEMIDAEEIGIHGGSIRVYISRKGIYPINSNLMKIISEEEENKIFDIQRLNKFANDVELHREKILALLYKLKSEGASIVGVSAPAKGMTLLNYCHIGPELLNFITEKSQLKIGKYTPGLHIPVVPDSVLLEEKPDYALLLAWNFADEIMENLSEFRKNGGKFIIPIPEPHIV